VRVLPPAKQGEFTARIHYSLLATRLADVERSTGTNYHFGLRIIPTQSTSPPASPRHAKRQSIRETVEYVIWRRWEDCLDFQRTLEVEYHAVSKRRRKGEPALNHHAKDMLYPSQRAASFESLPLGPDPSTIPVDVHAHIPRLSKRSTLFRMNEAVIQQRGEEVKAMIEALFDKDAPSTLQELQTVITVRDFFGYWRRDKEAERKIGKAPASSIATPPPPYQGKGSDHPKPSIVTLELIAFATGGRTASPSKPKHLSTRGTPRTNSTGSREAPHISVYEPGRPTAPAFAQVVPPHTPFSVSAAATSGEPHKRRPPSYRPAEGTLLFRSPALLNPRSNTPVLDSPRPSSPYTNPSTSPHYGDGFNRYRQSSSPHILSAWGHPSLPAQYSPSVGDVFTNPVPLAHPMQGRTVSMPAQRRQRDGRMPSSPGPFNQLPPVPIPRRRNGAIDTSGNRTARYFDASTDVVSGPPSISPNPSEREPGTDGDTRHPRDPLWRRSQHQAEVTASGGRLASVTPPHHTESRLSYGSFDMSTPLAIQTLLSTGYSTPSTTPQSSQHSSTAAQRHRVVPSWSMRRMSLDSLAPIDLALHSNDKRRPYVTEDPNVRHSMSSNSSYTDGSLSDTAPTSAPSASMPSLIPPPKIQPSSVLQAPSPTPPRPPRSALRVSSISSYAVSSTASSPRTPAEDGGAAVPVDIEPPKRASTNDDVVDSYLNMPSSAKSEDPFELEFRPQPPPTPVHRPRGIANHAGRDPRMPLIVVPPPIPPNSTAFFSPSEVSPKTPATPLMGATTTVKAVHEASGTILLFRVPRMNTSLADLRAKLSRKFMDAENIKLYPEQLELRCLAPAPFAPSVANRSPAGGAYADRSDGLWLPLNTDADWYMAAANASGKVTVKVF